MPLFLGVMIQDMREQSTNHPTSKLLERVEVILMVLGKEKLVETTFHEKILRMLKQDFCIDLTASKRLKKLGGRIRGRGKWNLMNSPHLLYSPNSGESFYFRDRIPTDLLEQSTMNNFIYKC